MDLFTARNLIYKNYGPLSLTLRGSQSIGLTGPSGSGKTLFLRVLSDLDPYEGEIKLDNKSIISYFPPDWRKNVSLLPAESQWWHDTIGHHYAISCQQWLEKVGFAADVMNWQVSRLSTGEKQRLALVRLLCNKPQVLLLDEPTANLDKKNVHIVEELLHEYRKKNNAGLLWVSHDMDQLKQNTEMIYNMSDGKLEVML
ncbi:ATP-binding cassette domain-containing protein [candidate division KSB1 bacterium]|nr:ATP-binding cassette domain-containing protein [candidate division KSB1 bacterium]